ncbi:hypothetical protein N431DRAFT_425588 [Stipitochalara longipes BDJ]|nr:hypothetical protein N431DRAFT_425588 [Stipitochalara longipes BDJ]
MDMVGFVPEPDSGRGTVGIIWSCLTTIFLSTWTSYHIDFVDSSTKTKILETTLSVFIPEVMAAMALKEAINAWYFRKALRVIPGWERFSLKQAFLIQKGGVTLQSQSLTKDNEFFDRARLGIISFHQFPQNSQIDARSKSDWLSKMIAICQALWFASNIASRLVARYEISLLEGLTTAYVFCGLVMFVSWYQCPQDIKEKFDLQTQGDQTTNASGEKRMGGMKELSTTIFFLVAVFFLAIFTGIHLAAWNYLFASAAETWIWRILSIATFILGLGYLILGAFEDYFPKIDNGLAVVVLVYAFVRLGVTGLAFAAFRHAPAGIYLTTRWPAYWGHISG